MDDKTVKTVFINVKGNTIINELPDEFEKENLKVGRKVRVHIFTSGWRIYKIRKIEQGDTYKVYIKRVLF